MAFSFSRLVDLYDTTNVPWESDEPTYAGVPCTPRKPWVAYAAYNQVDYWSGYRTFIFRWFLDPAAPLNLWSRDATDIRKNLFLVYPEIPFLYYRLDYVAPLFSGETLLAWYVTGRQVGHSWE